jgi:hypothetical protein
VYHLRDGLYTYPVEYINGTWYRISWTIDQCYEVSREDEIKDPQGAGLGIKNQLFLLAPDLECIHTEATQGSDETPEAEVASPTSDPDVPTTVTAAYATITSRLGVVVIRLLAAAFWLGVGNR